MECASLAFISAGNYICALFALHLQVTFTNEQTGEYQYFELFFRAVRPGVISSIQLLTPVRQSKQHTLLLENPLNNAVTFSASCSIPEIQLPGQLSVPALSEVNHLHYDHYFLDS